jgi:hypothetical protein
VGPRAGFGGKYVWRGAKEFYDGDISLHDVERQNDRRI